MKVKARRAKPAPHVPGSSKLLGALGCKVRALRAARGLTRRELAARSGLSERFLARIEAGDGNVSLLRFAALADALGVFPADLLRDATKPPGPGILRDRTGTSVVPLRSLRHSSSSPKRRSYRVSGDVSLVR